jgi:hypothetical protein
MPARLTIFRLAKLFSESFNIGDMSRLQLVLDTFFSPQCALKTPALAQDVLGKQFVVGLFSSLLEDHPDAFLELKRVNMDEKRKVLHCRIAFSGTRYLMNSAGSRLYTSPTWSLTDEMDLATHTEAEVRDLQLLSLQIRSMRLPHLIRRAGEVFFHYNESYLVTRVEIDWMIESFSPVVI